MSAPIPLRRNFGASLRHAHEACPGTSAPWRYSAGHSGLRVQLTDGKGPGCLETRASRVPGAKGVFAQATGRSGYSSSELIRGRVSDARALANISACSHCLRVRLFR